MAAGGERPEHRVVFFTESALEPSDPENRPVLILGQVENLKRVDFSRVNKYLSHRVDEVSTRILCVISDSFIMSL